MTGLIFLKSDSSCSIQQYIVLYLLTSIYRCQLASPAGQPTQSTHDRIYLFVPAAAGAVIPFGMSAFSMAAQAGLEAQRPEPAAILRASRPPAEGIRELAPEVQSRAAAARA